VSLKNLISIENKLLLHKNVPIGALDKQPFYRFQILVEDWIEEIKQEKEERDKRKREQDAQDRKMKMPKTPSYKPPKLK
jgi:hypothetical protein